MHVFSQTGSWKVPIGLLFWCRSEDIHVLCLLWQLKRVRGAKRSLNLENHTGILQPKKKNNQNKGFFVLLCTVYKQVIRFLNKL